MAARAGQRQPLRRNAWTAVTIVLALVLCYAVLADALGNLLSRTDPGLAIAWRPGHARALELQAAIDMIAAPAAADATARRALAHDLSRAGAVRVVGLSAVRRNDQHGAAALFAAAERLNRRDLPTQLYFIEASVGRGNVAGALRHFDIAMRTSLPGRELLAPVLCNAMLDRRLINPIARLLQPAPEWTGAFVGYCVDQPQTRSVLAQILTLAPAARRASTNVALAKAVQLVAEAGDIAIAHRLYRALLGDAGRRSVTLVADPTFRIMSLLPPFDWNYVIGSDLGSEQGTGGLGVHANSRNGVVASQLLLARMGRYRLRAKGRDISGGRIDVSLACASGGQELATLILTAGSGPRQTVSELAIPSGCPAQWLRIAADTDEGQPLDGRVELIDMAPSANAGR